MRFIDLLYSFLFNYNYYIISIIREFIREIIPTAVPVTVYNKE